MQYDISKIVELFRNQRRPVPKYSESLQLGNYLKSPQESREFSTPLCPPFFARFLVLKPRLK